MKNINSDIYQARAEIAQALAHPSRLIMLDALQDGELCVCDLTKLVKADQTTISKHLAILKNSGLVQTRRKGTFVYYRLCCPCLGQFFHCLESMLRRTLKHRQNMLQSSKRTAPSPRNCMNGETGVFDAKTKEPRASARA